MGNALTNAPVPSTDEKYVKKNEFILYLVAVFFYTNMTGMIGGFRNDYLVNVLKVPSGQLSKYNVLISVIPFVLNFFIAMYIDGRKMGKGGKFRPLGLIAAVPTGILLVMSFVTPKSLTGTILMIYIVTVAVSWSIATNFGNSTNMVAIVMTPNLKERDNVISFRSIVSAVGNSAPLAVVAFIGIFAKDKGTRFIISAALCGAVGIIAMLIGRKKESSRGLYKRARQQIRMDGNNLRNA